MWISIIILTVFIVVNIFFNIMGILFVTILLKLNDFRCFDEIDAPETGVLLIGIYTIVMIFYAIVICIYNEKIKFVKNNYEYINSNILV